MPRRPRRMSASGIYHVMMLTIQKVTVADCELINKMILTGMPAAQLQRLPEEKQAQVFQRLIDEESIGFSQLARLTGIEKGRIKRLIL